MKLSTYNQTLFKTDITQINTGETAKIFVEITGEIRKTSAKFSNNPQIHTAIICIINTINFIYILIIRAGDNGSARN